MALTMDILPRYTNLSFSLLEDTGFFTVNRTWMETSYFGKGKGCGFLSTSSCSSSSTSFS